MRKCCRSEYGEALCREIAGYFGGDEIQTVIAPAVGGILVGYEVARRLGARSIFAERENGAMVLRRGFRIFEGDSVLICEDVTTTGGSVNEIVGLVRAANAGLTGMGALWTAAAARSSRGRGSCRACK